MADELEIALDRDAEVPIGVQLTWALRTRIRGGALVAGQRLPGLHRLAEQTGVNANTIRAVYLRLEQEGLVETRHGSGTYVAGAPDARDALTLLTTNAVHAARDAGIDPREVAAALYMQSADAAAPDAEAAARRRLRAQIASLEQALAELLVKRPDLAPSAAPAPRNAGPRLLSADELEQQRAALLRQLGATQAAVDAPPATDAPQSVPRTARAAAAARRPSGRLRPA